MRIYPCWLLSLLRGCWRMLRIMARLIFFRNLRLPGVKIRRKWPITTRQPASTSPWQTSQTKSTNSSAWKASKASTRKSSSPAQSPRTIYQQARNPTAYSASVQLRTTTRSAISSKMRSLTWIDRSLSICIPLSIAMGGMLLWIIRGLFLLLFSVLVSIIIWSRRLVERSLGRPRRRWRLIIGLLGHWRTCWNCPKSATKANPNKNKNTNKESQ